MKIYTIGHSNRSLEEFIQILQNYDIEILIDIRRFPKSRKYTYFNIEDLSSILPKYNIKYIWEEKLGGFRKFGKDVKDIGIGKCFKSESFRAYATYILTNDEVKEILKNIENMAKDKNIVLMCSERFPWNCHRKIVSDWFLYKGFKVIHIIDLNKTIEHKFTQCAEIENGELKYI
ncbi:hypothetical protein YN1_8250 [Nanoarchaeota archaeon]